MNEPNTNEVFFCSYTGVFPCSNAIFFMLTGVWYSIDDIEDAHEEEFYQLTTFVCEILVFINSASCENKLEKVLDI